jgi:hypothetical protein
MVTDTNERLTYSGKDIRPIFLKQLEAGYIGINILGSACAGMDSLVDLLLAERGGDGT